MEELNLADCCGLYCEDCINYKGLIADLARDLRKKLREAEFDRVSQGLSKFFKEFKNYAQFSEVVGAMVRLRCRRTCRSGGGPPVCKIRACGQKIHIQVCWECDEFKTCDKLDFLKLIHEDADINNFDKLKKQGIDKLLEGKGYWELCEFAAMPLC